jgi:hypothetical protein
VGRAAYRRAVRRPSFKYSLRGSETVTNYSKDIAARVAEEGSVVGFWDIQVWVESKCENIAFGDREVGEEKDTQKI